MNSQIFVNNFSSTIAVALDSVTGVMTLAAGDGAKLRDAGVGANGDYTRMEIVPANGETSQERVYIVAVTGDVATILRSRDNARQSSWAVGSRIRPYNKLSSKPPVMLSAGSSSNKLLLEGRVIECKPIMNSTAYARLMSNDGSTVLREWNLASAQVIGPFEGERLITISCSSGLIETDFKDASLNPASSAIVAILTGNFEVGGTITATLPTGCKGTIQFTRTTDSATPVTENIAGAVANNVNSLDYVVQEIDGRMILGALTSNVSSPSQGRKIPLIVPHVFSCPAIGLFDYSDLYNRAGALTKHDSTINYYSPVTQTGIRVILPRFIAMIGNSQEQSPSNDLKFKVGIELQNPNGTFRMARFLFNGSESTVQVMSQGGVFQTDILNDTILANTYYAIKIEITHPDGVSVIQVPRYSASDYAREVLASPIGEGVKYNTAGDLSGSLNSNPLWSGKTGDFPYRPIAVVSNDPVVPKSVVLVGDSNTSGTNIPSGSRSAMAKFLQDLKIPFINIARSGGSQLDWQAKTVGRAKVLSTCKTMFSLDGMNAFGTGVESVKAAYLAQWAQARAEGIEVIIHFTIPPDTSAASTGSTSWDSLEAQNPQDSRRLTVNAWAISLEGQPGGPDYVFDLAKAVSTPDGLKWLPNCCRDGIHTTTVGRDIIVASAKAAGIERWIK